MVFDPAIKIFLRTIQIEPLLFESVDVVIRSIGVRIVVVVIKKDKSLIGGQQFGTQRTPLGIIGKRPLRGRRFDDFLPALAVIRAEDADTVAIGVTLAARIKSHVILAPPAADIRPGIVLAVCMNLLNIYPAHGWVSFGNSIRHIPDKQATVSLGRCV